MYSAQKCELRMITEDMIYSSDTALTHTGNGGLGYTQRWAVR
jgi:hypothetical protein